MTPRKGTPREIAESVADAGALIGAERHEVVRQIAWYIRDERKGAIQLTRAEARAALDAIGQMTGGNAYDFVEWRSQTSGTLAQWQALLRAEEKLRSVAK